jgi:hypothetical protein
MSAVNHAAAAQTALDAAAEAGAQTPLATQFIAAAQVHATLALVEEQRTANLIAAFERDAIQPPHASGAANTPFWNALSVDITERLDLA